MLKKTLGSVTLSGGQTENILILVQYKILRTSLLYFILFIKSINFISAFISKVLLLAVVTFYRPHNIKAASFLAGSTLLLFFIYFFRKKGQNFKFLKLQCICVHMCDKNGFTIEDPTFICILAMVIKGIYYLHILSP